MATTAESQPRASQAQRVRCPRCGYDQRGVVETWKDSCPLDGICSECGLEWRWAEVFNPRLHRPTWCVEYGRLIAFPWRVIKTLAMSFLPWRFWWALQMHHDAHWWRIAVYLFVLLCALYLAFVADVGAAAYRGWRQVDAQFMEMSQSWVNLTPERRQAFIEKGYVPDNWIVAKRLSPVRAVAHAMLLPLSTEYSGQYVFADGTTRPYQHYPLEFTNQRFGRVKDWLRSDEAILPRTLCFPLLMSVILPGLFALLPMTRRIARVRFSHIARIALYSLVFGILACTLCLYRIPNHIGYDVWGLRRYWGEIALLSFIILPAILFLWWASAIARHLRMQRPWTIAVGLFVIAYLLPMAGGHFWLIVGMRPDWFIPGR